MGGRGSGAAAGVLVLLVSACGPGTAQPDEPADDDRLARVERMADDAPAALIARIRSACDREAMRATVTRTGDSGEAAGYTFLARRDAWRVETRVTGEAGTGDGWATLLAVDDQVCFDREFRPLLAGHVAESYGAVDFDPQPWSCTETGFGLNPLVTFDFRREDPRWRIETLTTDVPGSSTVEVVRADEEPLLHLRTTGLSSDGPLDPARPTYDLWVDADHLPVRLETQDMTWELDYPAGLEDRLEAPAAGRRGSYGYLVGPGHGVAKACYWAGRCPEGSLPRPALTWGDGRPPPSRSQR